MLPQTARVERRGPVTILTIDRPAVRNCIDAATADGIASAIETFGRDDDARVLVSPALERRPSARAPTSGTSRA
jgi:enoyl-CoA hydratase/carnithine racemase